MPIPNTYNETERAIFESDGVTLVSLIGCYWYLDGTYLKGELIAEHKTPQSNPSERFQDDR